MENLIGHWPNLSRAYEIALLGSFSIEVRFNKEYIQGFEDYNVIKSFFNDVEFSGNGDIVIEIVKPDYTINGKRFETKEDIHERVNRGRNNNEPSDVLSSSVLALLKFASERLSFSLETYNKAIKVGKVIARLSGSDTIQAEHIAEAIHYFSYCGDESYCIAETKSINFGPGINISLSKLHPTDVNNAIRYLKALIFEL